MKKLIVILTAIAALALVVACPTTPAPADPTGPEAGPSTVKVQLIEHKGTAFGRDYPKWLDAALDGAKAVEKLPDYAGKYCVIVDAEGEDLEGTQLAASRLNAQTVIAQYLSTRVEDKFAGAQVGDKDKLETYMERVVKSVSGTTFSGFTMEGEWWVHLQYIEPDGKLGKRVYRVIQLWTIDKAILQEQLNKILEGAEAEAAKTPEEQRAIDLVQESFYEGF